jgi:hypothetical protein
MELKNIFAVAQTVSPKTGLVQQPVQIAAALRLRDLTISVYLPPGQVFVNHRWPPAADKPRWTEPPGQAAVRGDLNRRPVPWFRLWRANLTGGNADLQWRRRQAFSGALHAMNCACCEHFVRRCMAPLPHPAPARHCAPLQAQSTGAKPHSAVMVAPALVAAQWRTVRVGAFVRPATPPRASVQACSTGTAAHPHAPPA